MTAIAIGILCLNFCLVSIAIHLIQQRPSRLEDTVYDIEEELYDDHK